MVMVMRCAVLQVFIISNQCASRYSQLSRKPSNYEYLGSRQTLKDYFQDIREMVRTNLTNVILAATSSIYSDRWEIIKVSLTNSDDRKLLIDFSFVKI